MQNNRQVLNLTEVLATDRLQLVMHGEAQSTNCHFKPNLLRKQKPNHYLVIHYLDQAGLKLTDICLSLLSVLGLKEYVTTPSPAKNLLLTF